MWPTTARYDRKLHLLPALVIFAAAFVAFIPSLPSQFVNWDDQTNFVKNEHYRGLGWAQLKWMWTATLIGHWVPLTWMSLGLNYVLGGMDPWGYHVGNLLLHAANAVLFYVVARRLLAAALGPASESRLALGAAFAALIFGLHPLRVEAVAWITARRDTLSAFFFVLTVLAWLRAVEAEGPAGRRWRWGALALYGAALLSKSAVVTLPAVLLLLDLYPLRRLRALGWRRLLLEKVPFGILAGAVAAVIALIVARQGTTTPYDEYGVAARAAMILYSFVFHPWAMLWPVGLSPLYELPPRVDPLAPRFLASTVTFVLITAALAALARRWPAGLAAWIYSAVMVLPVSGVMHVGYQLAADRYSYLSGLGFALLAGGVLAGVAGLGERGRIGRPLVATALGAAALGLALLGAGAWEQCKVWRNSETLWSTTVGLDPSCAVCQMNLGSAMLEQGRHLEAETAYRTAVRLRPDRASNHNNLGTVLVHRGRYVEAEAEFREALRLYPQLAGATANLGGLYGRLGRYEDAAALLRQALAQAPDSPDMRSNLARALRRRGAELAEAGRRAEAIARFREALQALPDDVHALRFLGQALVEEGKPAEAVQALRRAVALGPGLAPPRYWLARAYVLLGDREQADAELAALRTLDPVMAAELERRNPP